MMFLMSCRSESPAEQCAKDVEKIAAEIDGMPSDASTMKRIEESIPKWNDELDAHINANADYVLTEADKEALKKAVKSLFEVSTKKSMEVLGERPAGAEAMINQMLENTVYPAIDSSKTLGDLNLESFI